MHDDGTEEEHEELKARLYATKAALARIDELAGEEWTRDDTIERMRGAYEYRKRRLPARAGKIEDEGFEDRSVAYQTIVREVLEAQRGEIVRLRNEGTISNDVMHRLERELDLEDERLEGSKNGAGEVGRLDEAVAQRADHRLDLLDHALAVELGQRAVDQVGAAVELDVEALGDLVGDRDLAPDLAFAAAQAHPPGLGRDGLPVDGVDEVLAAGGAGVEVVLRGREARPSARESQFESGEVIAPRSIGRSAEFSRGANRTYV